MNHSDTLACAHDDDLVERAALGLLAPEEEPALARRLAACPACHARLNEERALAAAVATLDRHPAPIALDAALPVRRTTRTLPDVNGDDDNSSTAPARVPRRIVRRRYEGWYVAAAVLLLAGMAAFTFNAFAGSRLANGPHLTTTTTHTPVLTPTATPRPLALPAGTMLTGLSMVSPNEGWAIGQIMRDGSSAKAPVTGTGSLLLHYTAGQWTIAARYPSLALASIAMVSTSEGWISGSAPAPSDSSQRVAVLLHYHAGQWTQQYLPGLSTPLDMQMVSASEGWALGGTATIAFTGCPNGATTCSGGSDTGGGATPPHNSGILHYSHGTWSVVTFPEGLPDSFWWPWHPTDGALSMDSPNDGWAISQDDLMQYHDGQWSYGGKLANIGSYSRITMLSASDGWATGPGPNNMVGESGKATVYHYEGKAWSLVPTPTSLTAQGGDQLLRAFPESAGSAYFVAGLFIDGKVTPTVVMRYAAGTWQPAGFPANIFVSTIQGSWALGWVEGELPWHSVILHQQGGVWVTWPEAA
ncbi:MAG TPA: hypothetical protein VF116_08330 [Ktedonobacterales bacterium]